MDRISVRSAALLSACILIPLASGAITGFATMSSVTGWYQDLAKPWITPPGYVFGPVWTVLYILMGISLYLILAKGPGFPGAGTGTILFAGQLAANLLWSILFFGLHSPVLALADIFLLLALIAATMVAFSRVERTAALLLVPYFAWVCIATALNAGIVILN